MSIQRWFPWGLTSLILLPKGLSSVSSSTTVRKHQFFGAQPSLRSNSLTSVRDYRKSVALTRWTFLGKVTSLLFNTLSRFVIAFLPLISSLQSLSTVILEPKKIKSVTLPLFLPSLCHEVMGPDAVILVFWMLSFKSAIGASQLALVVKNPSANAEDIRDMGSIPVSGTFPGGGHSNPLQYSCLESSMGRGAWQTTVHGITKSQTRLSDLACMQASSFTLLFPTFSLPFSSLSPRAIAGVSEWSFRPGAETWGLERKELDQVVCPGHLQVVTHPRSCNTGPLSHETGPLWGGEIKKKTSILRPIGGNGCHRAVVVWGDIPAQGASTVVQWEKAGLPGWILPPLVMSRDHVLAGPASSSFCNSRIWGPPWWLRGKDSAWNAGDTGAIPGPGRSPGEGSGNPLQYSCLENSMNRGDWWVTVHGVAKEPDTTYRQTTEVAASECCVSVCRTAGRVSPLWTHGPSSLGFLPV